MTKNRSLTVLVVVLAVAVVLTGGLMASNMGFKLNRDVLATAQGRQTSASGTSLIALPYNRQVGIDTARGLFEDMGADNVTNIQAYDTAGDAFVPYAAGLDDWPLVMGQGYVVKQTPAGLSAGYIVVGSHAPEEVIQLEGAGPASASGTNLYSPPYHGTAATARGLFVELGTGNVQNIQKYDTSDDSYVAYAGGLPDFDIVPGDAYFIKMGTTLAYSPSHY